MGHTVFKVPPASLIASLTVVSGLMRYLPCFTTAPNAYSLNCVICVLSLSFCSGGAPAAKESMAMDGNDMKMGRIVFIGYPTV